MADAPSNADQADTEPRANKKGRRKSLLILLAVILLGLAGGFTYYYTYGQYYESTDDAYVQGNLVTITPQISGIVTQVVVDDGDYVHQGQPIVRLDPTDTEVALNSAKANLANVVRQVRGLYNNVSYYQSQLQIARVNLEQAQTDYKRRKALAVSGAISNETAEHARDALNSAQNQLLAAQQQLYASKALTDNVSINDHPQIKAAIAQLQQAYLAHQRHVIRAPTNGYVAQRTVQLGNQVQPGTTLMAVVPLQQIWIEANFKESQMNQMRLGQKVDIEADLYGNKVDYQGHIESLGIGTGSAFSLLPAQNASGNWIKIVQRLPVRIQLDDQTLLDRYPLRIGLSLDVRVHLRDQQGDLLPSEPKTQPRYATDVYQHQLADAHQTISRILIANGISAEQAKQLLSDNHSPESNRTAE